MTSSITIVDVETTGLSVERDAIIEIGAVRIVCGEIRDTMRAAVRVTKGCSDEAADVNRYWDRLQAGEWEDAVPIAVAIGQLIQFRGEDVVGYWSGFDAAMLDAESMRIGIERPRWGHHGLDLASAYAALHGLPHAIGLDEAMEREGIKADDLEPERHTALGDARLAARVWLAGHR